MYTGSRDVCRLLCMAYTVASLFTVSWKPSRFQGKQVAEVIADLFEKFFTHLIVGPCREMAARGMVLL